ncbi:MAG: DnaD domain protein [Defluviitaleaceae bacterium]|nr:DnaD domain protein [Defluviitaleaceae bacterium]
MLSVLPLAKKHKESERVQIPARFVDTFLASSMCVNPLYVVVYLFALRYAGEGEQAQISFIAARLEISEANVLAALSHWASLGILSFRLDNGLVAITFNDEPDKSEAPQEPNVLSLIAEPQAANQSPQTVPRPTYTPEELEIYSEREEIRALFESAQHHLGRLLNYNDMNQIFSFYDWLRLPTSVIDKLLAYCRENGHTNMAYIERVALDWAEQGIDTREKAQDYIQLFNKDFREILKAFGIFGRNPGASEQEYMRAWLKTLEIPRDMVVWACDQAVLNTGGVSFSYADKIIRRWHEEGITTLEAAKAQTEAHKSSAKPESPAKKPRRAKKDHVPPKTSNRYLNFKQRDYDFDQIKAMELERLKQEFLAHGAQTIPSSHGDKHE